MFDNNMCICRTLGEQTIGSGFTKKKLSFTMTQLQLRIRLTAPQGSIAKNTIPVNINPKTQECTMIFSFFTVW